MRQVFVGLVDPGDVGDSWCLGSFTEAVWVGGVGVVEDGVAGLADGVLAAGVDVGARVVADA